jgi:hypothetical protein
LEFDKKMNEFSRIKETVDARPITKDYGFLQIDMSLVVAGISRQVRVCDIAMNSIICDRKGAAF